LLKKQKSGLYRAKVTVGYDPAGKPVVKYISGKTREELESAKKSLVETYILGQKPSQDRLFGDYAKEWFTVRKKPFVSGSSVNSYRSALNKHIFPVFGNRYLNSITSKELQEFLNGFEGFSKSQISIIRSIFRGIFLNAKMDGILKSDPSENLIRPKARKADEKRALTDEERKRVCRLFDGPNGLYIATMYYTGMRPGEVRGLKWSDVDWSGRLIHVQRDIDFSSGKAVSGTLKTEASDRFIPLVKPLYDRLEAAFDGVDGFIFQSKGLPFSQTTSRRIWLDLMVRADMAVPIPEGEVTCYGRGDIRGRYRAIITPHALRHNFITMCWEQGLDIMLTMKLVGHTDYETTRKIYTHLSKKHLENAASKLEKMFFEK